MWKTGLYPSQRTAGGLEFVSQSRPLTQKSFDFSKNVFATALKSEFKYAKAKISSTGTCVFAHCIHYKHVSKSLSALSRPFEDD